MTTLTMSPATAPAANKGGSAFARVIGNFFAGAREGHVIARRYDALRRMSDGELAAVGVSRRELPQAAVRGYRK